MTKYRILRFVAFAASFSVAIFNAQADECIIPDPSSHIDLSECIDSGSSQTYCEKRQGEFLASWQNGFDRSDINGLRFVADQLSVDAFHIVRDNPMMACAFRKAIAFSSSSDPEPADYEFAISLCSKALLNEQSQINSIKMARLILARLDCLSHSN